MQTHPKNMEIGANAINNQCHNKTVVGGISISTDKSKSADLCCGECETDVTVLWTAPGNFKIVVNFVSHCILKLQHDYLLHIWISVVFSMTLCSRVVLNFPWWSYTTQWF